MSIKLSARFIEVVTRYFKIHRSSIESKLDINENDDTVWHYSDTLYIDTTIDHKEHLERCEEYDDENENNYIKDECKTCGNKEIVYYLFIVTNVSGRRAVLETIKWKKEHNIDMVNLQLNKLVDKIYYFCKCGEMAVEEDLCGTCYIHSYTRPEEEGGDCSICLENGGRWSQLECKHNFHMVCIRKVGVVGEFTKCPLCRHKSKSVTFDPFDI